MKKKYLVYCLVASVCISCSSNQDGSDIPSAYSNFIDLDKEAKESNVSYLDFFTRVVLIPLETTKESMIHKIDKIISYNNKFYILDRKQKAVIVFNHEGGFIKKFSQVGNGPGEYKYLQDFEINRFTNNIELLEPWGVINVYDSLGNFVEKYRLPSSVQSAHYFTHLNSDTIAIYSTIESNRLTIFSKKQDKVIKQFHEIPQWVSSNTPLNPVNSPFYFYNDTMNFYEIFSNDVSFIENCDLKLKYSWDFGKHNFSYKDLAENKPSKYYIDYYRNSGKAQYIFYNLENEKYIFTSFMFNGKIHSLILDKKTNKLSFFEKFKEGPWFYAHAFFDKGCFAALEMENLKRFVTPDILDSENQIIYNKLNAEDNPVIVEYYY